MCCLVGLSVSRCGLAILVRLGRSRCWWGGFVLIPGLWLIVQNDRSFLVIIVIIGDLDVVKLIIKKTLVLRLTIVALHLAP